MRDCAECHVGGGGMEHVMAAKGADLSNPLTDPRTRLRTNLKGDGSAGLLTGGNNSYEFFIGQYEGIDADSCPLR